MPIVIFLAAHWRTALVLLLVFILAGWGAVMRLERDSARATVAKMEAAGRAQAELTKAHIEEDRQEKERVENDYKARMDRLSRSAVRDRERMLDLASRSIVPAIPDPAGGGDEAAACFDRGELNRELTGVFQRFAERLSTIASEGEGVAAAFQACAAWAIDETK